jgi:hypothetical protein
MTEAQFRRLAMRLPDVEAGAHQGHADFRVEGRIFASLGVAGSDQAMVRLPTTLQQALVSAQPDRFIPCNGAWGRQGCTFLILSKVTTSEASSALAAAHEHRRSAPPRAARKATKQRRAP